MRGRDMAVVMPGLLFWCSAWGAPSVALRPQTVDWGRQAQNKGEYPYTITVQNVGDEVLQITNVRAGCSCTTVDLKKRTLAPGESTAMTGTLTTSGLEGSLQKGIILTTNDPEHQAVAAMLAIRFPIDGQGLRLRGTDLSVRRRDGALWAYLTAENCEPDLPILIEAMELPEGWDCPQPLPITVPPEERITLILTREVEATAEVQAFADLPFALVTNSAKTPRLQSTLAYRPEILAAPPDAPAGPPPTASPSPPPAAEPAAGAASTPREEAGP